VPFAAHGPFLFHLFGSELYILTLQRFQRPDILYDPQKDYALSALDAYESYRRHVSSSSHITSADESRSPTRGGLRLHRNALMEGKGMLSWCMNENDDASTVVGRVVDDELEVWVELTEVRVKVKMEVAP
jgi:hypothetical protein